MCLAHGNPHTMRASLTPLSDEVGIWKPCLPAARCPQTCWRRAVATRPQVHKFESMEEVERLARVMRHYDNDGDVVPAAALHGETIIRAGQTYFPNSPFLLLLSVCVCVCGGGAFLRFCFRPNWVPLSWQCPPLPLIKRGVRNLAVRHPRVIG